MASGQNRTRNRLAEEKSPYLLQHAANPVDWYPWGEEAFRAARESNKLIFLSVGYSTCHWCHVMERESFENPEVAEIMNEYYINVKVDREERPDVDKVYMTFVQATQGGGGWPMSVFLTPTLKPIFGGTYFPPEDSMFGRPGFKSVLRALAGKWESQSELMVESGDKIVEAMGNLGVTPSDEISPPDSEGVTKTCFTQLVKSYDPDMGGFSKAPKFPQPVNFNFLFGFYAREPGNDRAKQGLKMALHTLEMMSLGGINDHVSKGFARYSTDAKWHVPHFEKMLYDQAQLTVAFSNAYQVTKEPKFARVVNDILEYVNRDLKHPLGAFYSAEDADSLPTADAGKKKEGAFCVWTYDEFKKLLGSENIGSKGKTLLDLTCLYFGAKPDGNVDPGGDPHGELTNQNVLTKITANGKINPTEIATELGLDGVDQLDAAVEKWREILNAERQKRPRPHLDDKIITAWNGLMISGFCLAGMALQRPEYIKAAEKAANFLKDHMFNASDGTLFRSSYSKQGQVEQLPQPIHGFVDDYAFLIRGLLDLYEATLDPSWIEWADKLQEKQNALFWDSTGFGYFTAPEGDPSIVLRLKEDQDGAEPSANSVSSSNLQRLAAFTDNSTYKDLAVKIFHSYKETLEKFPVALPEMAGALMNMKNTPMQIIISGSKDKAQPFFEAIQTALLPQKVLIYADDNKGSILYKKLEILKNIKTDPDSAKAFVCQNYACSEPVNSVEALIKLITTE